MFKIALLFLAAALASAATAFEITVTGSNNHGKDITTKISKEGTHLKGTLAKITRIEFDSASKSHVLAICEARSNRGPTAMLFTPDFVHAGFNGKLHVDTETSSGFEVLPLAQLDNLCKSGVGAASGVFLKLVNDWSPTGNKQVPTHGMLFREPKIYAVHSGFEKKMVYFKFENKDKQKKYEIYLCLDKKDSSKRIQINEKGQSEGKIEASGVFAVDIFPRFGPPSSRRICVPYW